MSRASIVWAEDDLADRVLIERALRVGGIDLDLQFVDDGMQLFRMLSGGDDAAAPAPRRRFNLIVLDLNMPGTDGRRFLQMKALDPGLRRIPAIVMTTSGNRDDIDACYDLGASSYIRKPRSFDRLIEILRDMNRYWTQVSELPDTDLR